MGRDRGDESRKAPKDLRPGEMDLLPWGEAEVAESLKTMYARLVRKGSEAIEWYLEAKDRKKLWARALRLTAILLATAAAMVPLVAQLGVPGAGPALAPTRWMVHPAWAAILLAAAAALVLLDRFFGFSTGWMRYIRTEMQIRQMVEELSLDWQQQLAPLRGEPPTTEQVMAFLARGRTFVTQLNAAIQEETSTWIQEFQSTLRQVDEVIQARAAETRPAAVTVVVVNGEQSRGGWTLFVDGRQTGDARPGRSAAVPNLWPGNHSFRAAGAIDGRSVQAERSVVLAPGEDRVVELTLA